MPQTHLCYPQILLRSLKYKGNPNYFGGDTFTYKVCDQGGLCSVEYTATVTVTEVN
ncbi:Ig-like domain-containing protein, partial [Thiolapillus sp.]